MKNKRGFTLLELLIAATIIGTLVVLATVSYRSSAAETRVAAAKAQTEMLAGAVQRFSLENRVTSSQPGQMVSVGNSNAGCTVTTAHELSPENLIYCGFVENSGWNNDYFKFYICDGRTGSCSSAPTSIGMPLAYMESTGDARMPAQYGSNYSYWVGDAGQTEVRS